MRQNALELLKALNGSGEIHQAIRDHLNTNGTPIRVVAEGPEGTIFTTLVPYGGIQTLDEVDDIDELDDDTAPLVLVVEGLQQPDGSVSLTVTGVLTVPIELGIGTTGAELIQANGRMGDKVDDDGDDVGVVAMLRALGLA
jgi:hypothetical protein